MKLRLPFWVRIPLSLPFMALAPIGLTATMERYEGDPPFWALTGAVVLLISFFLVGFWLLSAPLRRRPTGRRRLRAAIAVGILILCAVVVVTVHGRSEDPGKSLPLLTMISLLGAVAILCALNVRRSWFGPFVPPLDEVLPARRSPPGDPSVADPRAPSPLLEPPEDAARLAQGPKSLPELDPREMEVLVLRELYSPRKGWGSEGRWIQINWFLRLPIGGAIFATGPIAQRAVRWMYPEDRPWWAMAMAVVVFVVTFLSGYSAVSHPPDAFFTGSRWWRWPVAITLCILVVIVGPRLSDALEGHHPLLETFAIAFTLFVTVSPAALLILDSPIGRAKSYPQRRRALYRLIDEHERGERRRWSEAQEQARALERGGRTPNERIRQLERFLEAHLPRDDRSQDRSG